MKRNATYTESSALRTGVRIPVRRPEPPTFPSVEEQYQKAKARLITAQQEKMEAAVGFLAARAALNRWMEEVWPGQERPEAEGDV